MEENITILKRIAMNVLTRLENTSRKKAETEVNKYNIGGIISDFFTLDIIKAIQKNCQLNNEEGFLLLSNIYEDDIIDESVASKIRTSIDEDTEGKILDILSYLHDEDVKRMSNYFLISQHYGQIVDFRLLSFQETEEKLTILQPIFEACGIEINRFKLKEKFYTRQIAYMKENNINTYEDLVNFISKGSESYPILDGLEISTKVDESQRIDDWLKDEMFGGTFAEFVANQIESKIACKTDLHTHINAILPNDKFVEMADEFLGMNVNPKEIFIDRDGSVYGDMKAAYAARKPIVDELLSNGYGQEYIEAIAKELTKSRVIYAEITVDKELLKKFKNKK